MRRLYVTLFCLALVFGLILVAWPWRNYVVPLKIGVEGGYPPFSKSEPDGSVSGFEIDLALLYCKKIRARCELVKLPFDQLLIGLDDRRVDAVMASLSITPERQKKADFSTSYYHVPNAFIGKTGSITSVLPGALGGKRIAVLKGSPRETWLRSGYPEAQIITVAKEPELYPLLSSGEVDLVFGSTLISNTQFFNKEQGKSFQTFGTRVYLETGVGIAVRLGDKGLLQRFNSAIRSAVDEGQFDDIAKRYFDFDIRQPR
jgi:arginine/ornithine transport system substrate-binding protein